MIEEAAKVVAVDGDKITVEAQVKSTCNSCQAQDNCGTGTIARAFSHQTQRLTLHSPMLVKVGDNVQIGIQEKSVLVASWWLYLMPLVIFITANAVLSQMLSHAWHELVLFGIASVPTFAAFVWVSGHLKRLDKGRFHPVILRKL